MSLLADSTKVFPKIREITNSILEEADSGMDALLFINLVVLTMHKDAIQATTGDEEARKLYQSLGELLHENLQTLYTNKEETVH